MFRQSSVRNKNRGSLLAASFLISAALGISLMGLLTMTRSLTFNIDGLLVRSRLRRMTHEKFTTSILSLKKTRDISLIHNSTSTFTEGDSQVHLTEVPEGLGGFPPCLYLVVVTTLTKESLPEPHHMRLETIIDLTKIMPPPAKTETGEKKKTADLIDEQLAAFFPDNPEGLEGLKAQIFTALEEHYGIDMETLSLAIEMDEYRDPSGVKMPDVDDEEKKQIFIMTPLNVQPPKNKSPHSSVERNLLLITG